MFLSWIGGSTSGEDQGCMHEAISILTNFLYLHGQGIDIWLFCHLSFVAKKTRGKTPSEN